jgi:hypothetical protein
MEIPPLGEATVLVLLRGTGKQTERRGKNREPKRRQSQVFFFFTRVVVIPILLT